MWSPDQLLSERRLYFFLAMPLCTSILFHVTGISIIYLHEFPSWMLHVKSGSIGKSLDKVIGLTASRISTWLFFRKFVMHCNAMFQ
jgi:hypothetical protein